MNITESIILGLIQGVTEFLPVSSSGHLIIARELLGLDLEQSLSFDVFMHLATLLAIIFCFFGDLRRLVTDFFSNGFSSRSGKLIWALALGTIPAGLVGFFYGGVLEQIIRQPLYVALALIAGGIVFFFADQIPKSGEGGISPLKGLFIGAFQMFALIPGVSRSGITISGGLFFGLSREESIKFAFLLGIPIIAGAGLKTFLDLPSDFLTFELFNFSTIIGFLSAFLSGIWAVKFLVRYLSRHSFLPFIIYRLILAGAILLFL